MRGTKENVVPLSLGSLPANAAASPMFNAFVTREEQCISDTFPVWEKQYDKAAIGFVLSGHFDYSAQGGSVTGVPGTVLFGNLGEHFSVQHLDRLGNRRIVVWYEPAYMEEIAAAWNLDEPRFHVMTLPPGRPSLNLFLQMSALTSGRLDSEDAASALAAMALRINREPRITQAISNRDRQRILQAVGYIERYFDQPCSVAELAGICGLGRYRFMRLFKAVTGQSANQYVINTRLRAAAERITETNTPVSAIAFDVGFNDISHFNTCFRTTFELTPRQMRKSARLA